MHTKCLLAIGRSPYEYAMIARLPPICRHVMCTVVCVCRCKRQKLLSIQFDGVSCGIFYIFMDIKYSIAHCSPCVTGKPDPVHHSIITLFANRQLGVLLSIQR